MGDDSSVESFQRFDAADNHQNNSEMPEQNREILASFQEITGIDSTDLCVSKLEQHSWNLEAAVQSTFNENEGLPSVYHETGHGQDMDTNNSVMSSDSSMLGLRRRRFSPGSTQMSAAGRSASDLLRQNTWWHWLVGTAYSPYRHIMTSFRLTYLAVSRLFLFIVRLVWPSYGRAITQPSEDVISFRRQFEEQYGTTHPPFFMGSYSEALASAKKDLKFLIVYLHCKTHQDTDAFCRTVMTNLAFVDFMRDNLILWACDVSSNEGFRVSRAMKETTYPFLAVVCLRDNRMTIVWRVEGFLPVDHLIALLSQVIDDNEPSLIAARHERNERSHAQILRNEQDAAYQASLQADREKEELRRREQEVERKAEEDRRHKEISKQLKKQVSRKGFPKEILTEKARCRKIVESHHEPNDADSVKLRIKLPNGLILQRNFLKSDLIQLLFDYVMSHEDSPGEFVLRSNFPRASYHAKDCSGKTLEQVGIASSATLFVQDLLEEDSSDEDGS